MSSSTPSHIPNGTSKCVTGPASFQALSITAIDPKSTGMARWMAQQPHEESWNAMQLCEKHAGLMTGIGAPVGTLRETCDSKRDGEWEIITWWLIRKVC